MEEEKLKQKYEHSKYINKLAIIRNCISLICFTVLAIVFKNFWIVFGALLFTTFVEKGD